RRLVQSTGIASRLWCPHVPLRRRADQLLRPGERDARAVEQVPLSFAPERDIARAGASLHPLEGLLDHDRTGDPLLALGADRRFAVVRAETVRHGRFQSRRAAWRRRARYAADIRGARARRAPRVA